ncbi:uncharacterized protein LOC126758344 [Bactrocera neohumeralis]|uniref:uncharacterized protein LOC126758344 n=1 Tax=Bactrocera neohumeralis TaxID=98809 RepID=UPI002165EBA0|nr:uncharacterized protein LOC126758344 [Bactrocera neohumeralis]
MERNHTLESTFAMSLRNITDNELDALLHFDSPPPTIQFSQSTNQDGKEGNGGTEEANETLSTLQFNREELPSQMSSQVVYVNSFPDDLDFTLKFTQQSSGQLDPVVINSMEVENIEIDDTEITTPETEKTPTNRAIERKEDLTSRTVHVIKESSIGNSTDAMGYIDEIIKKELLDLTAIEDFSDDDGFAAFIDVNLNVSTELEQSNSGGANLERMCQSQMNAAKKENILDKQIYTSCPVELHIPALPSTISPAKQSEAVDYTLKSVNKCNPPTKNVKSLLPPKEFNASGVTGTIDYSSTSDLGMVPASVKQLYDLVRAQYSDFAFVYALSAQLCQDRVPMDCFVNLKMGLLLSLASISTNPDRPPIPMMVFGSDTYIANYLLTNIAQLSERFVGPADVVKSPFCGNYRNCKWIVADPILLASGGVYFAGDWSHLKMTRMDQVFRIIECSRVPVDHSSQIYPLGTAIWAHWRSCKGNSKDQQTFNKVVKIFGIAICMDDDEKHEVLVDYILEQSSVKIFESTVDHLSISSEDMRCFLRTISKRSVDLTPEASQLLQQYFVTSRFARPECLTKQAYVVLKQFAESFAKLCFRHEVLVCDVVAAVFMCERFLRSIFGVNENSPPAFESHNFVGSVDAHMLKFQDWLNAYIKKFQDK